MREGLKNKMHVIALKILLKDTERRIKALDREYSPPNHCCPLCAAPIPYKRLCAEADTILKILRDYGEPMEEYDE